MGLIDKKALDILIGISVTMNICYLSIRLYQLYREGKGNKEGNNNGKNKGQ